MSTKPYNQHTEPCCSNWCYWRRNCEHHLMPLEYILFPRENHTKNKRKKLHFHYTMCLWKTKRNDFIPKTHDNKQIPIKELGKRQYLCRIISVLHSRPWIRSFSFQLRDFQTVNNWGTRGSKPLQTSVHNFQQICKKN